MIRTQRNLSFCVFSTLLISSISLAAPAKKSAGPHSGICVNERGDYTCYVYNYAEKTVVASYPKTAPEDKSAEQRSATFPNRLEGDTGGKYSLIPVKNASFKPFSVSYINNGSGCVFTFSPPANPQEATAPKGYVVTSAGVGTYTNDSCQHDGATLTIKD